MPLFLTRKEVFQWLKEGKKTIEIRKGNPRQGNVAIFQAGRYVLRMKILRTQTGHLTEIVQTNNYEQIIPTAETLSDAIVYFHRLYGDYGGVFTAYYVMPEKS